jgi:hypothetical protein
MIIFKAVSLSSEKHRCCGARSILRFLSHNSLSGGHQDQYQYTLTVVSVLQNTLQYTYLYTEADFLEEIQTKVVRVFILLFTVALGYLFLQTHATSYSFYSSATVHCKGERRKT